MLWERKCHSVPLNLFVMWKKNEKKICGILSPLQDYEMVELETQSVYSSDIPCGLQTSLLLRAEISFQFVQRPACLFFAIFLANLGHRAYGPQKSGNSLIFASADINTMQEIN